MLLSPTTSTAAYRAAGDHASPGPQTPPWGEDERPVMAHFAWNFADHGDDEGRSNAFVLRATSAPQRVIGFNEEWKTLVDRASDVALDVGGVVALVQGVHGAAWLAPVSFSSRFDSRPSSVRLDSIRAMSERGTYHVTGSDDRLIALVDARGAVDTRGWVRFAGRPAT